jgi:hypothetical protein
MKPARAMFTVLYARSKTRNKMSATVEGSQKSIIEQQLLDMLAKTVAVEAALASSIADKDASIEKLRAELAARDLQIVELTGTVAELRSRIDRATAPQFPRFGEPVATTNKLAKGPFSFDFAKPESGAQKRKERDVNAPFFGNDVVGHCGYGIPGELGPYNAIRGKDGVFR